MSWFKAGGTGISPWGYLAAGLVIGLAGLPAVRKGARNLAVSATRGVLEVSDQVKSEARSLGTMVGGLVDDARREQERQQMISQESLGEKARVKLKKAGIATIKTGLNLADRSQEIIQDVKSSWSNLAAEVRRQEAERQVPMDIPPAPENRV